MGPGFLAQVGRRRRSSKVHPRKTLDSPVVVKTAELVSSSVPSIAGTEQSFVQPPRKRKLLTSLNHAVKRVMTGIKRLTHQNNDNGGDIPIKGHHESAIPAIVMTPEEELKYQAVRLDCLFERVAGDMQGGAIEEEYISIPDELAKEISIYLELLQKLRPPILCQINEVQYLNLESSCQSLDDIIPSLPPNIIEEDKGEVMLPEKEISLVEEEIDKDLTTTIMDLKENSVNVESITNFKVECAKSVSIGNLSMLFRDPKQQESAATLPDPDSSKESLSLSTLYNNSNAHLATLFINENDTHHHGNVIANLIAKFQGTIIQTVENSRDPGTVINSSIEQEQCPPSDNIEYTLPISRYISQHPKRC